MEDLEYEGELIFISNNYISGKFEEAILVIGPRAGEIDIGNLEKEVSFGVPVPFDFLNKEIKYRKFSRDGHYDEMVSYETTPENRVVISNKVFE